jgi:virulence factor Mce-like protein
MSAPAAQNRIRLILLGVFVTLVLALFGYLALRVGSVRTTDGIEVEAVFTDAQGLIENGTVKIAGIKVGVVSELYVKGRLAHVKLVLDPEASIRNDVTATIKAKSLLGEKFVELIPDSETAPMLKNGDIISKTFVPAELPDLASQIGPLLAKIDPNDVSRLVKVVSRVLEKNENDFPKIVESLGRVSVNVDGLLTRNGPKVDRIMDVLYDTVNHSGPKINKLVDTTQDTMSQANQLLKENGPRINKFTGELSQIDVARINRMIGTVDDSMKGMPETVAAAKSVVFKVDALLDGFEGLTWFEMKKLLRDDGLNFRFSERSEDDREADRKKWGTAAERGKTKPPVVREISN